jgi:hypothetical protein
MSTASHARDQREPNSSAQHDDGPEADEAERAGSGDVESHATGEKQAAENSENDPVA